MGLRLSFEHFATTVPDLDSALDFFCDALGADHVATRSYGPEADMTGRFNAHSEAQSRVAKVAIGGVLIELWEYAAPDLRTEMPRNCDAGGHHVGFKVVDIDDAVERLRQYPGVRVLGEPSTITSGPLIGRRWVYFLTPWGLQLELATTPDQEGAG